MPFAFSAFGSFIQVNHCYFPGNIKLHKLLLHKQNNISTLQGFQESNNHGKIHCLVSISLRWPKPTSSRKHIQGSWDAFTRKDKARAVLSNQCLELLWRGSTGAALGCPHPLSALLFLFHSQNIQTLEQRCFPKNASSLDPSCYLHCTMFDGHIYTKYQLHCHRHPEVLVDILFFWQNKMSSTKEKSIGFLSVLLLFVTL